MVIEAKLIKHLLVCLHFYRAMQSQARSLHAPQIARPSVRLLRHIQSDVTEPNRTDTV